MTTTSEGGSRVVAAALDSPEAYAAALTDLRLAAGMSVRETARAAGVPPATLGGYFSGRHLPSPTQPAVLARLLTALGVAAEDQPAWHDALVRVRRTPGRRPSAVPPYRGLESFGVEQAHLFFGRERLTDDLVALVDTVAPTTSGPRFVTVLAPSGAGKSSLVRAGLLGRRRAAGSIEDVLLTPAEPGALEAVRSPALDRPSRVVVVDQFEQVLHPAVPAPVRARFLGRLAELADPAGSSVVVVTLRADWFAAAIAEPVLLPLLGAHQLLVGPMTRAELTRAVLEPARVTGTEVDPAVAELVWRDVEESGAHAEQAVLPLLSHALLAAWQQSGGARLGAGEYLGVGGLASAVTRTAEQVTSRLPEGGPELARRLFAQLVGVTDEGVATRRTVSAEELAELPPEIGEIAEAFVASRLLTATANGLEISHDAVLHAWPRLQQWIDDDREQLRVRRRLRAAGDIWIEHGEDDGSLARGILLEQGRALLGASTVAVGPQERRFVEASAAHAERQAGVERRRRSTMRGLFAAVVALAVLASGLSVYLAHTTAVARDQRRVAQAARDDALSRQVALEADQLRTTAPSLANQLAVAAYRIAPTVDARSALFRSSDRPAASRLIGITGTMSSSVSPDGRLIVVSGADGSVTVWRRGDGTAAPRRIARIATGTPTPLYAGAFSGDGRLYFTGGQGRLVAIDLSDPAHPVLWPHQLTGVRTTVQALAFHDGILYAGTSDPSLLRWRISDAGAGPLPAVRALGGAVRGLAEAPHSTEATADQERVVREWRPAGPPRPPPRATAG
ncbi:MAG: nSTAND1 domain-containing NTPase, partial [Marmoricola sp.]